MTTNPSPPTWKIGNAAWLPRLAYLEDFREREARLRDTDSCKLERRQDFEEIGHPSHDAMRRGEWEESLRLLDEGHELLARTIEAELRIGYCFRRIRVIEEPLSPYVQWELHTLHQQALLGRPVSIVHHHEIESFEGFGPLPEMVSLGGDILYDVAYSDDTGSHLGAFRITDPTTVTEWTAYMSKLFYSGEDLLTYFPRKVVDLPAPALPETSD